MILSKPSVNIAKHMTALLDTLLILMLGFPGLPAAFVAHRTDVRDRTISQTIVVLHEASSEKMKQLQLRCACNMFSLHLAPCDIYMHR